MVERQLRLERGSVSHTSTSSPSQLPTPSSSPTPSPEGGPPGLTRGAGNAVATVIGTVALASAATSTNALKMETGSPFDEENTLATSSTIISVLISIILILVVALYLAIKRRVRTRKVKMFITETGTVVHLDRECVKGCEVFSFEAPKAAERAFNWCSRCAKGAWNNRVSNSKSVAPKHQHGKNKAPRSAGGSNRSFSSSSIDTGSVAYLNREVLEQQRRMAELRSRSPTIWSASEEFSSVGDSASRLAETASFLTSVSEN